MVYRDFLCCFNHSLVFQLFSVAVALCYAFVCVSVVWWLQMMCDIDKLSIQEAIPIVFCRFFYSESCCCVFSWMLFMLLLFLLLCCCCCCLVWKIPHFCRDCCVCLFLVKFAFMLMIMVIMMMMMMFLLSFVAESVGKLTTQVHC